MLAWYWLLSWLTRRKKMNLDYEMMFDEKTVDSTKTDRELPSVFPGNVAVAFDDISLCNMMEDTQREVIFTLCEVIDRRSKETVHHVKRVSEHSYLLALKYELGEEKAELLKLASPMHDVGKIWIPNVILDKPGKLSAQEFELMKTHTTLGYNMLKASQQEILKTAAVIALQHHEWWNGRGYPLELSGDQIDIFARITAVADVFDALSHNRVYRKAWDVDQILTLFRAEQGIHFDPDIVDVLLENIEDFLSVKDSYPEIRSESYSYNPSIAAGWHDERIRAH
jgi:response regulator RpfG family c-di-GMP phosphodiesterase